MQEKEQEIIRVINKIRPYIQRDGGDVEFVKFADGCVSVRMLGACSDSTIREGVELILKDEVEGVDEVVVVE